LGTFGLSKGLITRKGTAGRFGSILTDLFLTPDTREYKDVYEYCNMCGICAKKCPSSAISVENGKDCLPCYEFIEETLRKNYPRYGCGKCQVGVPCESRIPL
jgi:epoxyqueuosine reductase QueG